MSGRQFTSQHGQSPQIRVLLGWVAGGFAALIVVAVLGGCVVGLFGVRYFESRGAAALSGTAAPIYVFCLVAPLAVGPAVSLTIGIPAMQLRALRSVRPSRLLFMGCVSSVVAVAVFWLVGCLVALTTSLGTMHRLVDEASEKALDHYTWQFFDAEHVIWSALLSAASALAVLVVHTLVARRNPLGDSRIRIRRSLAATGAVTVVFGGGCAATAVGIFRDMLTSTLG
ncbi:hypothetical protein [Nocardia brasiliensis]|uniref:hypothetical protein n=1 Tax=Nocardia brasiliensis TaxID=37326 RepID=UPI00367112B1